MASYVSPEIRDRFDTLSADLKNLILERNVCLNNMYDLIHVLGGYCRQKGSRITASPSACHPQTYPAGCLFSSPVFLFVSRKRLLYLTAA